jgi:Mn2+/Fe2+ NRAMP family transporter
MATKSWVTSFIMKFRVFRKEINNISHEFFELMHHTFLAGTFRFLAKETSSLFILLLSHVSLFLLFFSFVGSALYLVNVERFDKQDSVGKFALVVTWIAALLTSLLYCYGLYHAVDGIAKLGIKH